MSFLAVPLASKSKYYLLFDRIKHVEYTPSRVRFPGFSISPVTVPTPFTDYPIPGDKPSFEPFSITFNADEKLENFKEVFEWMRKLSFPESHEEFKELQRDEFFPEQVSDAVLAITTNQDRPNIKVNFHNCFPIGLDGWDMDSTLEQFQEIDITATFAYSYYTFEWPE